MNFKKFTTVELEIFLKSIGGEIDFQIFMTDYSYEGETLLTRKRSLNYTFEISDAGHFTLQKGSENMYLDVIAWDQHIKPYKIKFFTKDNHFGLKFFTQCILTEF